MNPLIAAASVIADGLAVGLPSRSLRKKNNRKITEKKIRKEARYKKKKLMQTF